MAFQPVPDTVQAEIRYLLDNQEIQNDLYFSAAFEWTETTMAGLATALLDWWTNYVRTWQVDSLALKEFYFTPLDSAVAQTYSYVPTSALYGAYTDEPEPNNVSFSVKFNTAFRGKGSSGRNYAVGVADGFVVQNTFTDAYVNGIVGAYNNLQLMVTDVLPATWVHVRRTINKVKLPIGQTAQVQSATFTDKTVDSQRRRLPGRGQ